MFMMIKTQLSKVTFLYENIKITFSNTSEQHRGRQRPYIQRYNDNITLLSSVMV